MAFAMVFPGQGSQTAGMGLSLAERYPVSRAVFDEVDEALGEKLSKLIFEGPQESLTLTANAQPALMAVSLAAFRALEAEGFAVDGARFVAGHSLGEYSALAAAGGLSVGETARLLRIRGTAMQAAVAPGAGAMAAILGLDEAVVEDICRSAAQGEVCEIANDNGGGQLVISGTASAVERAVAVAGERGAKRAIPLPVSAPFHCDLMRPAAERMVEALAAADIKSPRIPLVSNVLARAVEDPAEIRRLLVEQVTGRVRWRESIQYLAANGVDLVLEVGAGKVLSGLSKRIDRSLRTEAVGSAEDVVRVVSI